VVRGEDDLDVLLAALVLLLEVSPFLRVFCDLGLLQRSFLGVPGGDYACLLGVVVPRGLPARGDVDRPRQMIDSSATLTAVESACMDHGKSLAQSLRSMASIATPMSLRIAATLRLADRIGDAGATAADLAAWTETSTAALTRVLDPRFDRDSPAR
jgi:hypothetical protein